MVTTWEHINVGFSVRLLPPEQRLFIRQRAERCRYGRFSPDLNLLCRTFEDNTFGPMILPGPWEMASGAKVDTGVVVSPSY
jgi:hypothetical protein